MLNQDWQDLKSLVDLETGSEGTFSNKTLIWKRKLSVLTEFREEQDSRADYDVDVELPVIFNYNYLRSWPVTNQTSTGQLDRQSIQVLINKQFLKDNNFLNSDGYFNFKSDYDRFVTDGIWYRAMGDTPASQVANTDLFITIIIQREEKFT